jgi:hypothetical protein
MPPGLAFVHIRKTLVAAAGGALLQDRHETMTSERMTMVSSSAIFSKTLLR